MRAELTWYLDGNGMVQSYSERIKAVRLLWPVNVDVFVLSEPAGKKIHAAVDGPEDALGCSLRYLINRERVDRRTGKSVWYLPLPSDIDGDERGREIANECYGLRKRKMYDQFAAEKPIFNVPA